METDSVASMETGADERQREGGWDLCEIMALLPQSQACSCLQKPVDVGKPAPSLS